MNWWPKFTPGDPGPFNANGFPSGSRQPERFSDPLGGNSGGGPDQGTWYKLVQFTKPAERALLADSRYWFLEAKRVPAGQPIPGQRLLGVGEYSAGVNGQRQAMYDFYRHGKYPQIENSNPSNGYYRASGGKISYNILYADGQVEGATDRETGYRACRLRFPG
ncbi:MAG TPA: hypothetical protein VGR35_09420 [Tepidisphaeraceae bacterium]|nr:hypothetical protein [Tepidisphaeraceae bacterium]